MRFRNFFCSMKFPPPAVRTLGVTETADGLSVTADVVGSTSTTSAWSVVSSFWFRYFRLGVATAAVLLVLVVLSEDDDVTVSWSSTVESMVVMMVVKLERRITTQTK
jgi:DNA-binding transcriptional regulator LsrR (DeoR family)